MSTNLESVLKSIQSEKNLNLTPENVRYGTKVFDVRGTLKPVTLQGGDTATCIYTGSETPIDKNGIWLNTDKSYTDIYIENERHTTEYSMLYSNDNTDSGAPDNSNIIKGIICPSSFINATHCQKGNIVHIFGFCNGTTGTIEQKQQHYTYDFDTNTWTKLADCPTPQGGGGAIWINNDIYIIGTRHDDYWNFVYKYNVLTDEWTRLADISITDIYHPFNKGYMTNACYDGNDTIYIGHNNYIFSYTISTGAVEYVVNSQYFSQLNYSYTSETQVTTSTKDCGLIYYSGYLICGATNVNATHQVAKYNINTREWTRITRNNVSSSGGPKLFMHDNSVWLIPNGETDSVVRIQLDNTACTKIKSNNIFSTYMLNATYPVVFFTNIQYDIFMNFTTNTKALTLNDKTYDFTNNTLIIYNISNGQGKYSTELFKNDKVLNDGKLLTSFNDVNLYDKANEQIIKNISTHYGNGTDWVQIK